MSRNESKFHIFLKKHGFTKPYFLTCFFLLIASVAVYVISRFWEDFAEIWARYPSHYIRLVLAKITNCFHFSIAEVFIICVPILVVAYFIFSTRSMKKDESIENYHRWLNPMICCILVIASVFCTAFGPCYFRHSLEKNLGIPNEQVSAQELYDTSLIICKELDQLSEQISFAPNGSSIMPYGYENLIENVNEAYNTFCESNSFIKTYKSFAKPLLSSSIFTFTHISGVYTFVTGEANINTNYPDYIRPFTVAHEMAHQRGIAKEEEANFVAYLVCIASDDAYMRYSAYTTMLDYLTDALYTADYELYNQLLTNDIPNTYAPEMQAYALFFHKYSGSTASVITGAINDTFLNSQGEKEGTASYGLVVNLAVSYYKNNTSK